MVSSMFEISLKGCEGKFLRGFIEVSMVSEVNLKGIFKNF